MFGLDVPARADRGVPLRVFRGRNPALFAFQVTLAPFIPCDVILRQPAEPLVPYLALAELIDLVRRAPEPLKLPEAQQPAGRFVIGVFTRGVERQLIGQRRPVRADRRAGKLEQSFGRPAAIFG
jgi:hypothetical protein